MKMASQAIVRPSVISVLGLICAAQFVLQLDFSIAGGLLTTGQQIGAAVGIALRATLSAARTVQVGSLASGYGFSYLVALGLVLLAMVLVATQLNHQACQAELARQRQQVVPTRADALLPQELKKQ